MPRPRYRITADDFLHAEFCLSLRIRTFRIKFAKGVSSIDAQAEYDIAVRAKEKGQRLDLLNAWCEVYLTGAEWTKLKSAIRKRRERFRRCDDKKSVTITAKAHRLLLQLSKRDNVTFSRILEHYLGNAVNSSRGRPGSRKSR